MYCAIKKADDDPVVLKREMFDVSTRTSWPAERIATRAGDDIGEEYQCFEFTSINAGTRGLVVARNGLIFQTADEFIAWRDRFPVPQDDQGKRLWKTQSVSKAVR